MLTTYDPNIRWAKHTVEIDLQQWEYRLTVSTTVGGNCKGFSILESALSNYADQLYKEQGEIPKLYLVKPSGESMEVELDCDDIENWLEEMCVGLRIVGHVEEPRK